MATTKSCLSLTHCRQRKEGWNKIVLARLVLDLLPRHRFLILGDFNPFVVVN